MENGVSAWWAPASLRLIRCLTLATWVQDQGDRTLDHSTGCLQPEEVHGVVVEAHLGYGARVLVTPEWNALHPESQDLFTSHLGA